MVKYKELLHPELTAIQTPKGRLYHQVGKYYLSSGTQKLIPTNRSYTLDRNGAREFIGTEKRYRKDLVIHEKVASGYSLGDNERIQSIFGKGYLFLIDSGGNSFFLPDDLESNRISPYAHNVLDLVGSKLEKTGLNYRLGIFGSRRVGLAKDDSDVDLLMWINPDYRQSGIKIIQEELTNHGYIPTTQQGREAEYARRYARRFDITNQAGRYLASKRNRFTDPNGVSVSLQCMSSFFDHTRVKAFFESIDQEWEQREISCSCRVKNAAASYNCPKYWRLEINGDIFTAISLAWMHQGMGDDENNDSYQLRAAMVETEAGKFVYLRDQAHYLIPRHLL